MALADDEAKADAADSADGEDADAAVDGAEREIRELLSFVVFSRRAF